MPTKSPWEFSPWHAHMKSLYICLICHMHTRLEAVWSYGIDLQQVRCASREEPQVKGPELCHGIPRQRDRSVRGRARSQSLCPGLLAPPVSGAGMQQAASLIIQKTSFPSAAHLHYFFSSLLCMHPHNKHACSLHGALLTSLVLHQRNPTSFFYVYRYMQIIAKSGIAYYLICCYIY